MVQQMLEVYDELDEPLHVHHLFAAKSQLAQFENRASPFMFWLSFGSLALIGYIVLFSQGQVTASPAVLQKAVNAYTVLAIVPFVELGCLLYLKEGHTLSKKQLGWRVAAAVFFPLRMGTRRLSAPEWLWLPYWGWSRCNQALLNTLRHHFSLPMIATALLIVPVLYVDVNNQVEARIAEYLPNIKLYLEAVQSFIWVAFTFEFILLFSITRDKLDYCKSNWIDVFIILLPLVSFLRSFRSLHGLARINRVGRVYRFRGVITKVRGVVLLNSTIHRVMYPKPQSHLKSLQKQIKKNRREKMLIEQQVGAAVQRIQQLQEKQKIRSAFQAYQSE